MDRFQQTIEHHLVDAHGDLPPPEHNARRRLIVAFSGGSDSAALLHAVANSCLPKELNIVAAHVNHGLLADSDSWEDFCREQAANLGVEFLCHRVAQPPRAGQNVEAWARDQRYGWFKRIVAPQDFVVTAHHLDDQLETFLLRLLRGAGPHGLSAIKVRQSLSVGYLIRPMLRLTKQEVARYLQQQQIEYVDDPSNTHLEIDRNYLRHTVLPIIRDRWPHAANKVGEAAEIQDSLAREIDRKANKLIDEISLDGGSKLAYEPVKAATTERRFAIIRAWCKHRNLGTPEHRHFREIEKALFVANPKATSCIAWKNAELRYYQNVLYLREREPEFDATLNYLWDVKSALPLAHGELTVSATASGGLMESIRSKHCSIRYYRQQGERCHPVGRAHSQSLKKLFQAWRVPPWERSKIPILWVDGEIAAVIPYCICKLFATKQEEAVGLAINFQRFSRARSATTI